MSITLKDGDAMELTWSPMNGSICTEDLRELGRLAHDDKEDDWLRPSWEMTPLEYIRSRLSGLMQQFPLVFQTQVGPLPLCMQKPLPPVIQEREDLVSMIHENAENRRELRKFLGFE